MQTKQGGSRFTAQAGLLDFLDMAPNKLLRLEYPRPVRTYYTPSSYRTFLFRTEWLDEPGRALVLINDLD